MINKAFISLEGLGHFRDSVLVSSIGDNSFIPVPVGTKAKSYNIYYVQSGTTKIVANPQPTEGTELVANTYWVLGPGSPDDEIRAPSVKALTTYVDNEINEVVESMGESLDNKVSSITYDSSTGQLSYKTSTTSSDSPIVKLEAGSNVSITYTKTSAQGVTPETGKITFAATDSVNFAGLATGESSGGKAASAATADSATESTWAAKIGNATTHPAIGGTKQPVYIANTGKITAGDSLKDLAYIDKGDNVTTQSQTTKFLRSDGTWAAPSYTTNTNTTYTFAEGSTNGAFQVTPSGGTAKSVSIHGLGSAAYANTTDFVDSSLAPAEAGAQVNVIETVKVNGSALTPDTNKAVDIIVPTIPVTDVQTSTNGTTYATVVDANNVAKINLSGYALKSDLTKIMDWKGAKTGTQLKDLTGTTEKIGNVYTCTENGTRGSGSSAFEFKAGYEYVVDSISNDSNKVITWVELGKYYSVPAATGTDLGGFKTGYVNTTEKKYAVELNNENKAFVAVPWENTVYTHPDSGATAGSYGDSGNQTPSYSGTFKVPYVTVDAKGHVTEITEHTVKIPASDNTDTHIKTTAAATNTTYYMTGVAAAASTQEAVTNTNVWMKNGEFSASAVHNAVWNDLTDRIPVDEDCVLEYGKYYCFDGEHYYQSQEYCPAGMIGIHSDTGGFEMGHKEGVKELQCSVAGFVLAYVDGEYPVGTALTPTCCGYLTEISKKDKMEYPERIVATYWKNEPAEYWGSDQRKVKVNGRKWVKIK